MFNNEFDERYAGRYFGKYRGIVVSTADPKKKGRIQVKVPSVMGHEVLGWAVPAPSSGGGENSGDISFPIAGDYTWIEFEQGDVAFPIWTGGQWGTRGGEGMLMEHVRGESDNTDYAARDVGNIPPSQFAGMYTNLKMYRSKNGSFLEFDDTPGTERVQIAHYKGSRLEFTSDGSIQEVSCGNIRRRSESNAYTEIGGGEYSYVGGERKTEVIGFVEDVFNADYHRTVKNVEEEGASYTGVWSEYAITCNSYSMTANSSGTLAFGKNLGFMVGSNFQMSAMDAITITSSNATSLLSNPADPFPTTETFTLHAYNGDMVLRSTDALGDISGLTRAEIVLSGNTKMENPLGANILLGGAAATEPMVLGGLFKLFFNTTLTLLANHIHPTPVGLSGMSTALQTAAEGPTITAWTASLEAMLSKSIAGKL